MDPDVVCARVPARDPGAVLVVGRRAYRKQVQDPIVTLPCYGCGGELRLAYSLSQTGHYCQAKLDNGYMASFCPKCEKAGVHLLPETSWVRLAAPDSMYDHECDERCFGGFHSIKNPLAGDT
jgi:hypothetical protein